MQTVLITGGTGMVGNQLTKHLIARGFQVIILTRKLPDSKAGDPAIQYALWDVKKQTIDVQAIQKADHIVHLAGAGVVDKRWTPAYKKKIVDSRLDSSALLIKTLQENHHQVKTVVSASAIGWYGEDPAPTNGAFNETDEPAPGFLGQTCKLWEASIEPVLQLGIRLVKLRIGIVLSNDGGALPEFKKPLRFGLAGILGNGKQVVSWVHIADLCRIFTEAIENIQFTGSYNAVAPKPVTNKMLTLELARKIRGHFFIPLHVPAFVLKLMLGESSVEVLKSTTVSCEKIKKAGFRFLYPTITEALDELCKK